MPRFFTGDELGAIKSISYALGEGEKDRKTSMLVAAGSSSSRSKTVQKLALHITSESDILLAAVHADASAVVYKLQDGSEPAVVHEWSEDRLKDAQEFVGLAATETAVFSCTSNGALQLLAFQQDDDNFSSSRATLPTRLCDWRLSGSGHAFAYGGDEVELSLWDTERAFSQTTNDSLHVSSTKSKKRKRGDKLIPGELWRAKNVPNDHLSLRQPVHNTSLTFLQTSSTPANQHLLVGTAHGHVRRYDTRAARRPVSDWKGIAKTGKIHAVEKGYHEHEVFISDQGSTLSTLDLRNGRTIYTYKGISGAVTSIAPAQTHMASASRDRFVRFHSTYGPPAEAGQQQERKGEVLDKLYMQVTPTVILWDGVADGGAKVPDLEADEGDDVWENMQAVDSGSEDEGKPARHNDKKSRTT